MKVDTSAACEAHRRNRLEREKRGEFPAVFMRLSLTSEAFDIVKGMPNSVFRKFASEAIRRAARTE